MKPATKFAVFVLAVLLIPVFGGFIPKVKATSLQTYTVTWTDLNTFPTTVWPVTINSAYHVRIVNNMEAEGPQYLGVAGVVASSQASWSVAFDDNASDLTFANAANFRREGSNTIDLYVSGFVIRYVTGSVNDTCYTWMKNYPSEIDFENGDGVFTGGNCTVTLESWTPPPSPAQSGFYFDLSNMSSGQILQDWTDTDLTAATHYGLTQDSNYLYDLLWGPSLYIAQISKSSFAEDVLTLDSLSGYLWCSMPVVDNGYVYAVCHNGNSITPTPLVLCKFSQADFALSGTLSLPLPSENNGVYTFTCPGIACSGGNIYALMLDESTNLTLSYLVKISESSFTESGNMTLANATPLTEGYFTGLAAAGAYLYAGASGVYPDYKPDYLVKCSTSPFAVAGTLELSNTGIPVSITVQGSSLYFAAQSIVDNPTVYVTRVNLNSFSETSLVYQDTVRMINSGSIFMFTNPVAEEEGEVYIVENDQLASIHAYKVDPSTMTASGSVSVPGTFANGQFVVVDSDRQLLYSTAYETDSSESAIIMIHLSGSSGGTETPSGNNSSPWSPWSPSFGFNPSVMLPKVSMKTMLAVALVVFAAVGVAVWMSTGNKKPARRRRR